MTRPKGKLDFKAGDWGFGWLAVLLGVISLYFYITSNPRRRRRTNQPRSSRSPPTSTTAGGLSKQSYIGWKILVNYKVCSRGFSILPTESPTLQHLASACDLYMLAQVGSDGEEKLVRDSCRDLINAGLNIHKVLFCSTRKGMESIARQLMPALYIDDELPTIEYLAAHLPHIALIDPSMNICATHTPSFETSSSSSSSSSSSPPTVAAGSPTALLKQHPNYRNVWITGSIADFFTSLVA